MLLLNRDTDASAKNDLKSATLHASAVYSYPETNRDELDKLNSDQDRE